MTYCISVIGAANIGGPMGTAATPKGARVDIVRRDSFSPSEPNSIAMDPGSMDALATDLLLPRVFRIADFLMGATGVAGVCGTKIAWTTSSVTLL